MHTKSPMYCNFNRSAVQQKKPTHAPRQDYRCKKALGTVHGIACYVIEPAVLLLMANLH